MVNFRQILLITCLFSAFNCAAESSTTSTTSTTTSTTSSTFDRDQFAAQCKSEFSLPEMKEMKAGLELYKMDSSKICDCMADHKKLDHGKTLSADEQKNAADEHFSQCAELLYPKESAELMQESKKLEASSAKTEMHAEDHSAAKKSE